MAEEQTGLQKVNTGMQIAGIAIAACWGIYTFIHKEIQTPNAAPVNVTVDLQLRKIAPSAAPIRDEQRKLIAVEMRVSARNPSTREVALLPSVWIAHGMNTSASSDDASFDQRATASLAMAGIQVVERHVTLSASKTVATGRLFTDASLKPNETTQRTLLLHVPERTYDHLVVETLIPTIKKDSKVHLEWRLADDNLHPFLYRLDERGERKELPKDADGAYHDSKLELQMARSVSEFSLWQEEPPARPSAPSGG